MEKAFVHCFFSKIQEKPFRIFTAVATALFYYGMQLTFFASGQVHYQQINNSDNKTLENGVQNQTLPVFTLFIQKSRSNRDLHYNMLLSQLRKLKSKQKDETFNQD